MTAEEAIARKRALTEQLRRIDEATDTAAGERTAEPGDLEWERADSGVLVLLIDGAFHAARHAVELTRAGIHECDVVLEEAGAFS